MTETAGWVVAIPVKSSAPSPTEQSLTYVTATRTDLAAACADLGVEVAAVMRAPDSPDGIVLLQFEPELVGPEAEADLQELADESLRRLNAHLSGGLSRTGDIQCVWG